MSVRVFRYLSAEDLAAHAAERLSRRLVDLQRDERMVHLCLTGGRIATAMYTELARIAPDAGVDSSLLELWWGDERFVPTDDPARNAGPALAALARTISVAPARTHTMPARGIHADLATSADFYANEVGDTVFDICLLGMGDDGHVASIFPGHPSFEPTTATAIGVVDAPKAPTERISLTLNVINRSREVWFLVVGDDKANAVGRALAGDPSLPATAVSAEKVLWFVDEAAAADVPRHVCSL